MDVKRLIHKKSVLVLNSSYEVLNETSWKRAVKLVLSGKADIHPEKDRVIRLRKYVKLPTQRIRAGRPNRKAILSRDDYLCQYCGTFGSKTNALTIDHVIPKSRGGQDNWDNMVCACISCNNKKDNRTPEEWGVPLVKRPKAPPNRYSEILNKVPEWMEFAYE